MRHTHLKENFFTRGEGAHGVDDLLVGDPSLLSVLDAQVAPGAVQERDPFGDGAQAWLRVRPVIERRLQRRRDVAGVGGEAVGHVEHRGGTCFRRGQAGRNRRLWATLHIHPVVVGVGGISVAAE